MPNKQERS